MRIAAIAAVASLGLVVACSQGTPQNGGDALGAGGDGANSAATVTGANVSAAAPQTLGEQLNQLQAPEQNEAGADSSTTVTRQTAGPSPLRHAPSDSNARSR
ncbi:MAG: hypothetical protein ACM3YM_11610 [Sphingomonadales bacterium]